MCSMTGGRKATLFFGHSSYTTKGILVFFSFPAAMCVCKDFDRMIRVLHVTSREIEIDAA